MKIMFSWLLLVYNIFSGCCVSSACRLEVRQDICKTCERDSVKKRDEDDAWFPSTATSREDLFSSKKKKKEEDLQTHSHVNSLTRTKKRAVFKCSLFWAFGKAFQILWQREQSPSVKSMGWLLEVCSLMPLDVKLSFHEGFFKRNPLCIWVS